MLGILFQAGLALLLIFPSVIMAQVFGNCFSAVAAYFLGDKTAHSEGFITLNPFRHMDISGALIFIGVILIASVVLGNSPLTSLVFMFLIFSNVRRPVIVPINEENFKNPVRDECLAIFAHPLGSIFYSFLAMCIMKIIAPDGSVFTTEYSPLWFAWNFLDVASTIGIQFGVLDLIPLPPQASGRIIQLLIPEEYEDAIETYWTYGFIILLCLFVVPGVSNVFFNIIGRTTTGIKIMFHKLLF